jgi:peptide/nickel transport system permease protein
MRRFAHGILILFGVSIITFVLPHLSINAKGLAINALGTRQTPAVYNQWIAQHHLNESIPVQYYHWLVGVLHGNFGESFLRGNAGAPVTEVIGPSMWHSFFFVFPPTIAAVMLAIPLGLIQAIRRNGAFDYATTTLVFVLYSTPAFLLCIIMTKYLYYGLNIGNYQVPQNAAEVSAVAFPAYMIQNFSSFVLPMLALLVLTIGGLSRFMRGSALDTLVQDYVRTARAKGASPSRVLFRHVLRPSTIPVITILGLSLPAILSGALIIEVAFNFPGMGLLTVNSVQGDDFPTVLAITLILCVATVFGNFLADIFMVVADPRIRLEGRR